MECSPTILWGAYMVRLFAPCVKIKNAPVAVLRGRFLFKSRYAASALRHFFVFMGININAIALMASRY